MPIREDKCYSQKTDLSLLPIKFKELKDKSTIPPDTDNVQVKTKMELIETT